jgi:hypothetical protein
VTTDRRQASRREEDEVLGVTVKYLEKQVEALAPLATMVAVHTHQLDEGSERMRSLEEGLANAHKAAADLLACINNVMLKVEGIQTKLAVVVGLGSLVGGGIVTAAISLLTG